MYVRSKPLCCMHKEEHCLPLMMTKRNSVCLSANWMHIFKTVKINIEGGAREQGAILLKPFVLYYYMYNLNVPFKV